MHQVRKWVAQKNVHRQKLRNISKKFKEIVRKRDNQSKRKGRQRQRQIGRKKQKERQRDKES